MTDDNGNIIKHTSIKTEERSDGDEHSLSQTHTPEPECQLNLLEHVESLHHQISASMDLIERELDGNAHTHTHTPDCFDLL